MYINLKFQKSLVVLIGGGGVGHRVNSIKYSSSRQFSPTPNKSEKLKKKER